MRDCAWYTDPIASPDTRPELEAEKVRLYPASRGRCGGKEGSIGSEVPGPITLTPDTLRLSLWMPWLLTPGQILDKAWLPAARCLW